MTPSDMRDVTRLAGLAGNLLSERRNLIQHIAALPHVDGSVRWAAVMGLLLEAEGDFYNVDGSLKAGLRSLGC